MRYPATEKMEIIRLVEQSHLPAKRTLDQLGIPRRTFYRWYDRYRDGGPEGLTDRPSAPSRGWTASRRASTTRSSTWRLTRLHCSPGKLLVPSPLDSPTSCLHTRVHA